MESATNLGQRPIKKISKHTFLILKLSGNGKPLKLCFQHFFRLLEEEN